MNAPQTGHYDWINRRGYGTAAAAVAIFIVYGSLVPLSFRSITFSPALAEFSAALSGTLVIDSRTDFVTNILLTIPLTYLTCAAFMTDRRGVWRRLLAVVVALVLSNALSVSVEFAQIFTRGRTDSLSDIVAQSIGSVFGVVLWLSVGNRVTSWMRETLGEREQPAMIQRILLAYCILFFIAQVMPLDLTLNLGQLAQKYRRGMILLRPFAYHHPTTFDMWWDYLGDVVLNIPVGAAAALLWTKDRARRAPLVAMGLGVLAVAIIEFAQVFVNSRYADSTDVLTGSIGVAIGVAGASLVERRETIPTPYQRIFNGTAIARVGVAMSVAALMSYHWSPFDFTTDPNRVTLGMRQIMTVPLYSYYLGNEFHALTEILRKFMIAAPLGVFLRLSWSAPHGILGNRVKFFTTAVVAFCVLLGVEFGQVFLPTRTPDVTDAMVGEVGVLMAMWLTGRVLGLRGNRSELSAAATTPTS